MSTLTATILATAATATALGAVRSFIRRFVVLSEHQAITLTLWIAHTHAIDAAECTAYLQINSATKRAGKTRSLEVMEPLVARPWFTGRTSAAALVRKVDGAMPTLLLDESDAAFKGEKEYAEALRGILNTGYRRSGKATLCVGQGTNITVRDFRTFCPKAIAGIGELPPTVADRAIAITLRRRKADEPCERWRERDGRGEAAPVREALAAAMATLIDDLREARPSSPEGLSDRQADVWEPLLAIADAAGGAWPKQARAAAMALSGSAAESDITVELLTDIRTVLAEDFAPILPSKDLIAKLIADEDRPWATWRKGDKPISQRGLAQLLKPLGIVPFSTGALRGYRRDAFADALARYLPIQVSNRQNANNDGPETAGTSDFDGSAADTSKSAETPIETGDLTHGHIDPGGRGNGGDRARF